MGVRVPARIVRGLARPGGTLLGSCHLHNFLGLAVSPGTLDPRVLALGYAQTPVEEMVCAFSAWLGTWAGLNLQGLVMGSNGGRRRQKKPSPAGGCVCVCVKSLWLYPTVCDPMDCMQPDRLLCPWDSPGKNTGEGSHGLL